MAKMPNVTDHVLAGEMLLKWIMEKIPEPVDEAARKKLLKDNYVEVDDAVATTHETDLPGHFTIMLRDKEVLQEQWERIQQPGEEYIMSNDLKALYREFLNHPENFQGEENKKKRMDLFRARLADYTFGTCGG